MSVPSQPAGRLANLPISFFAMVMGTTGLAIAWEKAGKLAGFGTAIGAAVAVVAALMLAVLLLAYGAKVVRYRAQVVGELNHPIKLSFFPTIPISFLLLAVAFLSAGDDPVAVAVARGLWIIGAVLQLGFTLYVMGTWMHQDRFRIEHMNPAWFIPAVGNMVVPVAAVPLGYVEPGWFFFAVGLGSWIVLLAIVVYRILFHEPIETRLLPSFFILMAPPAVAFIAWARLTGAGLDAAGRIFYYFGLFLGLLLLTQVRRFARVPFGLPSWAFAFPIAALAIATMLMYELGGDVLLWALGLVLLAVLTLVVAILAALTARDAAAGRICVPGR